MGQFLHIDIATTKSKLAKKEAVIVDIRDENSFVAGHIPGSIHLDNRSMSQFKADVDEDTPVIVTCYHGVSSQPAAQFIAEQGYNEVYSMDGGFTHWQSVYPDDIATGSE